MRVLAFRHDQSGNLGLIGDSLAAHGIDWEYIDLARDPAGRPRTSEAGGLIFLGGPMSANDDLDYIPRELDIIREAAGRGQPILGVCLGSQLIAKALGGRVYPGEVKEIGWAPVHWTAAGETDRLLGGLRQPETIFHWHSETFELPTGAEWLAFSEACRNQAFRISETAYGLQFHLELTSAMIRQWCLEDAGEGDQREMTAPLDPHHNQDRLREIAATVFGRWCELMKPAG